MIFENDYVTRDEDKVRLCEICSEHAVAFVKTSTGYGFVKRPDGLYTYAGATDHDLALMRRQRTVGAGEGGRRRADAGRPAARPRVGGHPCRRDRDQRDPGRGATARVSVSVVQRATCAGAR